MVAVGVVVPTLLSPSLARARSRGTSAVSTEIGRGLALLLGLFVPAALGLILISGRLLPALFGEAYGGGAILLVLIAARLPVSLAASWFGSALVALGREPAALGTIALAGLVALVAMPAAVIGAGPVGIGSAALLVEIVAAVGGWITLRRIGLDAGPGIGWDRLVVGCIGLVAAVALTASAPLAITCLAGAVGYGAAWGMAWMSRMRRIEG